MSTIVISGVAPAAGTALTNNELIGFSITDSTSPLVLVIVAILYPGLGLYEVVYDGTQFTQHYQGAYNSAQPITHGTAFTILRNPVWPDGVNLHIFAAAADGTVASDEIDWPLAPGQATPPPPAVVPIVYPITGGVTSDAIAYDQQHFLDMFDRLFPLQYMYPLESNTNSGYEIFQASAKIGERISLAVQRLENDSYVITAAGGQPALGEVQFYRSTTASGSVTIKEGSLVTTSVGNRDFVTLNDLSFTAGALGPLSTSVASVANDYDWNVPGQRVLPNGVVIPGDIDTILALILDPPYGETTLQVQQLIDTTGGRPPTLDGLGADRLIFRNYNETDPHYALRIRSLPDTVSPLAIIRNLTNYFPPLGISFSVIEQWDVMYQTCYDAPTSVLLNNPDYDPNLFFYDEPAHSTGPFHDRWLDELEDNGAFIVVISQGNPIYDVSMAFDDTGVNPSDFQNPTTGFQRGDSAYDVASTANPSNVYPACYDGFDLRFAAAMLGVEQLLQQIKAGGVAVAIENNLNPS